MAEPLTDREYAEWKGNIEAIAKGRAGEWYKRKGNGFVPAGKPGPEITTTVEIQLRLFATIDALHATVARLEGRLREHHHQLLHFYKVCPVCLEKLREEKSDDALSDTGEGWPEVK